MQADIITIGDEILIGQIIDTNSSWIARQLNLTGIKVKRMVSISDNKQEIFNILDESFSNVDLILLTGGLGPTKDDITKQALASYFNTTLELNYEVLTHVENLLAKRNLHLNELNQKQAELPVNCKVIHNACGTAPGMWFEKGEKVLVAMPGVPFEMIMMMENQILSLIKSHFKTSQIIHKTIMVHGISESALALNIAKWENALPEHIKLAYLPSPGIIRLRLSGSGANNELLDKEINTHFSALKPLLGEKLFAEDDVSVQEVIGNLLLKSKKTLALAESCTGGNIAHLITLIPGSSAYFKGGVVAYSNEIKIKYLGISENALQEFGAVSEFVVREMARNVAQTFGADFGIGISGIAGPDGGTPDKPVGTVWIAVFDGKETVSARFLYGDSRERNITRASVSAFNMLRLQILKGFETV